MNKICLLDLEVPHYLSIFVLLVMIMKAFKAIICLLVQFYCTQALVNKSEAQCSGQVCIPMDYEKVDPPILNDLNWMNIEMDKIQIQKVDDIEKTISLSVEIYLLWKEPRLNIKSSLNKNPLNEFSLYGKKRFEINFFVWRNSSKFAIFIEKENPRSFFRFSF